MFYAMATQTRPIKHSGFLLSVMAASSSHALLASLLFFLLAFHLVYSFPTVYDAESVMMTRSLLQQPRIDCRPACDLRCSRSWKLNMCKKLCAICCNKCNCVPPGTSAEARAACPCYANMKNPKGNNKCP